MFQYPHGNFPSSGRLFSRGKLRLAHFLSQCAVKISTLVRAVYKSYNYQTAFSAIVILMVHGIQVYLNSPFLTLRIKITDTRKSRGSVFFCTIIIHCIRCLSHCVFKIPCQQFCFNCRDICKCWSKRTTGIVTVKCLWKVGKPEKVQIQRMSAKSHQPIFKRNFFWRNNTLQFTNKCKHDFKKTQISRCTESKLLRYAMCRKIHYYRFTDISLENNRHKTCLHSSNRRSLLSEFELWALYFRC